MITVTQEELLVRDVVAAFPALRPMLDEHIHDYDEVLAHIFLADVVRYLVHASENRHPTDGVVAAILEFLENRFRHGNEEVKELISVSFVEMLPRPDERGAELRAQLGTELAAEAARVT